MSGASWICSRCILRSFKPPKSPLGILRRAQSTTSSTDQLSPALLSRARSISNEHNELSKQLLNGYDIKVARKLGELSSVTNALKEWDHANEAISELRSLLKDSSTDPELRDLASEDLESSAEQLHLAAESLTKSLIPKHPFASLPCLIELRPGAGGSEAALFAGELLRMYESYCSSQGLRASRLKYEEADAMTDTGSADAALAEAVLEIQNEGAYDTFRVEAGVHRVQRVPATESKGRTHTSAVSVLVMPSFPDNGSGLDDANNFDDPSSDYYVDAKDVRVDIMRARGAGGQHVNTTDSAVRLTHLPTKTVVSIQDSRSQPKNREKAWRILRSRLAQARREAREEESMKMRRDVVGLARMGREDKVRTYNWGQQRVTDHRSGLTVYDLGDVMEGGHTLDKVMQSVKSWMTDNEIKSMTAEDANKSSS